MNSVINVAWQWMKDAERGWRQFWFAAVDPFPLAILRILNGLMLVYTHFTWGLKFNAFFGPNGWHSTELMNLWQRALPAPSFWWLIPPEHAWTAHLVCLGVLVAYTVGFLTPLTSVLSAAITISYAYRAELANFGLDQINAMLVTGIMVGPAGAALSVDRLLFGKRVDPANPTGASSRANLSMRLIQAHLSIMYLFAGMAKLQGPAWWDGRAVWMAVSNLEYQSGDATWLATMPWLMSLLTHVTIFWELTFLFGSQHRWWRPLYLAIGAGMHLGIGGFLGMWTFGLAMITAYVAFIPGATLRAWLGFAPAHDADMRDMRQSSSGLARVRPLSTTAFNALSNTSHLDASDGSSDSSVSFVNPTGEATTPRPSTVSALRGVNEPNRPFLGHTAANQELILIVDDRSTKDTALQESLLRHGYRCAVMSDARQVLAMAKRLGASGAIWNASEAAAETIGGMCREWKQAENSPAIVVLLTTSQLVRLPASPESDLCRVALTPCSVRDVRTTLESLLESRAQQLHRRARSPQTADDLA